MWHADLQLTSGVCVCVCVGGGGAVTAECCRMFLLVVFIMVLVRMTVTPAKAVCVPFIHQNVYLLRELVLI